MISIILMAISPILNKLALAQIDHVALGFYNSLVCLVFLSPVILHKLSSINKSDIFYLLMAGIFNGLAIFSLFYGLETSSPALVSLLNRTYIVFSILFGAILLKEKIARIDKYFIPVIITGLVLFLYKGQNERFEYGAIFGIFSGLLFSLCNLTIKERLLKVDNSITLFFINLSSVFLFLFMSIYNLKGLPTIPIQLNLLLYITLGAISGGLLGLLFFYRSLKEISFYKANLYRSISPVINFFIGFIIFPVRLNAMNITGLVILLFAFVGYTLIKALKNKPNVEIAEDIEVRKGEMPDAYHSVLAIVKNGDKWLMVKNKKRAWEFPGGHRELSETYSETAKRETYEEAGILIEDINFLGHFCLPNKHTTLVVSANVAQIDPLPCGFETVKRKFVSKLPRNISFNDGIYPWLIESFIL